MTESSVEIKQLSVGFQILNKTLPAVDGVSFSLKPGKTLALLGESGCGKSITSQAIMRLLPNQAVYGCRSAIELDGQDILNLPEAMMRGLRGRRLAMIFQEPMTALNPVLSIGEQLAEALLEHTKLNRQQVYEQSLALLKSVEMPQPEFRLKQYPHQLSGGQKQRIVLAMALACSPDVIIADEPTTALDVTIQAQILALLKKQQRQEGQTILLITHDLGVVRAMADDVCLMYAGQIVESSPAEAFFSQPFHPYAQQLFLSLPSFSKRAHLLHTLNGMVPSIEDRPKGCYFHPRCPHAFLKCSQNEPSLQLINGRFVRCHLYPEQTMLPSLSIPSSDWPTNLKAGEVILSVEDLKVHFHQKRTLLHPSSTVFKAVDGLSFTLQRGKTLALVGESGCGKTTTGRALIRLQPMTAGHVYFQGQDVGRLRGRKLREFRKKVQIIFQDPYASMNPRLTIDEILAEGMLAQGLKPRLIRVRQCELLDQVNLPQSSLTRYPHQFSGGQRQRICIARALATKPELVICDEPTSALDMSVQAQILNLLKSLQLEFGLSYLFITHNMGVVSYIADEVLVMREGKAVEVGDCKQILTAPQKDYTRQLLDSVLAV